MGRMKRVDKYFVGKKSAAWVTVRVFLLFLGEKASINGRQPLTNCKDYAIIRNRIVTFMEVYYNF